MLNPQHEHESLRKDFVRWGSEADLGLTKRYALRLIQSEKLSVYRRLRRSVGLILRQLGLRRSKPQEPWVPGLRHFEYSETAKPLVIWALGMEREALRAACGNIKTLHAHMPDFVPILITDAADFAFFSRLGWLVEYIPSLSGPSADYAGRKRRYLAWRYRDATVIHASAGLKEGMSMEELVLG